MDLGQAIFIWIIGLFALYLVVRAAINGSDLAKDARAIRTILEYRLPINYADDEDNDSEGNDESEAPKTETDDSICPSCGAEVSILDKDCPQCGLSIK